MDYFSVYVEDRVTHQCVCILDMATRSEASSLVRQLAYLNACDVYFCDNNFYRRRDINHEERNGF